jgi:predicted metalloprotease
MSRFRCRYAIVAVASLVTAAYGRTALPAPTGAADTNELLFRNVESFWSQQIAALGGRYRSPKLVEFTQAQSHVCDVVAAVTGPFYCPIDETVYLDQSFLQRVASRGPDSGKLALGYLIAHEVAHHIQNVIGTTGMVVQARARSTPELAGRLLTTMELQADCYAGLWAHWAGKAIISAADVSASMNAVAEISRERQQRLAAGQEMLDPFMHGNAAQRLKWFRQGLDSGSFNDCDTFGAQAKGDL